MAFWTCTMPSYFNPRLPGGRRHGFLRSPARRGYFNPRLPGGRRQRGDLAITKDAPISIHASRVGGDKDRRIIAMAEQISIHASRVGGDLIRVLQSRFTE